MIYNLSSFNFQILCVLLDLTASFVVTELSFASLTMATLTSYFKCWMGANEETDEISRLKSELVITKVQTKCDQTHAQHNIKYTLL